MRTRKKNEVWKKKKVPGLELTMYFTGVHTVLLTTYVELEDRTDFTFLNVFSSIKDSIHVLCKHSNGE